MWLFLLLLLFSGVDCKIVSESSTKLSTKITAPLLLTNDAISCGCTTLIGFNNVNLYEPTFCPITIFTISDWDKSQNIIWCPWVLLWFDGNYNDSVEIVHNLKNNLPVDSKYLIMSNHAKKDQPLIDAISKAVEKAILIRPLKNDGPTLVAFTRPNFLQPFKPKLIVDEKGVTSARNIIADLYQGNSTFFLGENIVAATFHFLPYNRISREGKLVGGFEGNIMNLLMRRLNLSMSIQLPTDGYFWGRETPPGSLNFTGVSGDVQFGRADIGFAYLFVTSIRTRRMDFSIWYKQDPSCGLVKKPAPMPKTLAVFWPFDLPTWTLFTLMIAFLAGFFFFAFKLVSDGQGNSSMVFPLMLSILLSQSLEIASRFQMSSPKMVWLLVVMVMVVLSYGYAGSLTSMLTKDVLFPPTDTFEALQTARDRKQISNIVFCCPNFYSLSRSHPSKVVRDISRTAILESKHGYVKHYKDIVKYGNTVFFYTRLTLEFIIAEKLSDEHGNTEVEIMKECFDPSWAAIALQKRSLFKASFDQRLREMQEAGYIDRMIEEEKQLVARTNGIRTHENEDEPKVLTLDEVQAPLMILITLMIISSLAFSGEMALTILSKKK